MCLPLIWYHYCPRKHPFWRKCQPFDFDSYVVLWRSSVKLPTAQNWMFRVWAHIPCRLYDFDEFQAQLHSAAGFAHTRRTLILNLQYEIRFLQATNAAKPWQPDFGLFHFLAEDSFLYCHAGLIFLNNKVWAKLRCKSIQQQTRIWGRHLRRDYSSTSSV